MALTAGWTGVCLRQAGSSASSSAVESLFWGVACRVCPQAIDAAICGALVTATTAHAACASGGVAGACTLLQQQPNLRCHLGTPVSLHPGHMAVLVPCLQVCVPKNTVLVVTREKGGFLSVLQSSLSTGAEPDPRLAEVRWTGLGCRWPARQRQLACSPVLGTLLGNCARQNASAGFVSARRQFYDFALLFQHVPLALEVHG